MHAVARVPQISVSFAPEEPLAPEPQSPFAWSTTPVEDDGFRPVHLSPPPSSTSPRFVRQSSPLNPTTSPTGPGLERERFELLLASARNTAVGTKKGSDLRKEIALKAHGKKQVERRALFLSKVLAPPSPTSTFLPKTPPESPAIFNYTLPSPGLVSPLALFESLNENPAYGIFGHREPWVEQVDFRLPKKEPTLMPAPPVQSRPAKPVPSLDQITARLSNKGHVRTPSAERKRLAAFIAQAGVGRLHIRAVTPDTNTTAPPRSPCYPLSPKLQVTTLVVPRTSSLSPTALSESNLLALNSGAAAGAANPREQRAKNMLSMLRKRTDHGAPQEQQDEDRRWKRRSAPAELSPRARSGFEHPVFAMPGGF